MNNLWKNKPVQLLLALLTLSVAGHSLAEATPIDRVVAIVNDDVILASQLEERTRMVYRQLSLENKNPPPPAALRPRVLEQLILENLQLQIAERASVSITPAELQAAMTNMARQNGVTLEQLKSRIESDGTSFQTFQKAIERELIFQRVQQGVVNKRIEVTEQDITDYLHSEEGKLRSSDSYHLAHIVLNYPPPAGDAERETTRKLAYEIIQQHKAGTPFEKLASRHSHAPDAASGGDLGWRAQQEIPSVYADAIASLSAGEISPPLVHESAVHLVKLVDKQGPGVRWISQTRVRHILVKPSLVRNESEVVELLKQIRERVIAGEDFATLAKTYSEDYGSALKGGDLGWTNPGQLAPPFEQVMENSSLNTVSYPFQTPYGWHILQVLERRNENMTEELMRESVRALLTRRRFEVELPLWLQELRAEAYVVIRDPDLQTPAP